MQLFIKVSFARCHRWHRNIIQFDQIGNYAAAALKQNNNALIVCLQNWIQALLINFSCQIWTLRMIFNIQYSLKLRISRGVTIYDERCVSFWLDVLFGSFHKALGIRNSLWGKVCQFSFGHAIWVVFTKYKDNALLVCL